ncbi:MAG: hypothetical protein QE263_07480 [Vampirovibrionales bacterium]|nr:hypothetical protein [Vampirovibrionales bacterium]
MILFASSLSRTSYGTKALPKTVLTRVGFGDATRGDVNAVIETAVNSFKDESIVLTPSKVRPENATLNVEENEIVANGNCGGQFFSLYHSTKAVAPSKSQPGDVLRVPVNVDGSSFGPDYIKTALKAAELLK